MTNSYVRTATRTTLKVEANLTQILNFKVVLYLGMFEILQY